MYDKPSFRDAAKNAQRYLNPVSGFFEWRWRDEKGKVKIPYYVSLKETKLLSIAGPYSQWKDKATDQYYYTYTVLTTEANAMMEYVHYNKRRTPFLANLKRISSDDAEEQAPFEYDPVKETREKIEMWS